MEITRFGPGELPGSPTATHVEQLLERVEAADGTAAFSEAFLKGVRKDSGHTHFISLIDGNPVGIAGYSPDGSTEIAVDLQRRRQGAGRALAEAVLGVDPAAGLWAHGDGEGARALADRLGLRPTRTLLVMGLEGEDLSRALDPALWDEAKSELAGRGMRVTNYADAVDEHGADAVDSEWLDVNNAAFDWHPEQGGWDRARLREAMDTDWFDPRGVLLLWDGGSLAGFHWTKRHKATVGEVYVVGLSPDYRGQGLGDPLMRAGLIHLGEDPGLAKIILYVEADNGPAVHRYEEMGFSVAEKHVVYSGNHSPAG